MSVVCVKECASISMNEENIEEVSLDESSVSDGYVGREWAAIVSTFFLNQLEAPSRVDFLSSSLFYLPITLCLCPSPSQLH